LQPDKTLHNYKINNQSNGNISYANNLDVNALTKRILILEQLVCELSYNKIIGTKEHNKHSDRKENTFNNSEYILPKYESSPSNNIPVQVKSNNNNPYIVTEDVKSESDNILSPLSSDYTYEFVPYIINEDYAGCDNFTKLIGTKLELLVELLGFYSESPIIFPFGMETNLPQFSELIISLSFKDSENITDGTAFGIFKRRDDDVYIIELKEFYSNGNILRIEEYTLPLILECKVDLITE
jgi:hypothetical protein